MMHLAVWVRQILHNTRVLRQRRRSFEVSCDCPPGDQQGFKDFTLAVVARAAGAGCRSERSRCRRRARRSVVALGSPRARLRSVRIPRANSARVWVHVWPGAVVVCRGAVWRRTVMRCYVCAVRPSVAADGDLCRRGRTEHHSNCYGSDERFHGQAPPSRTMLTFRWNALGGYRRSVGRISLPPPYSLS